MKPISHRFQLVWACNYPCRLGNRAQLHCAFCMHPVLSRKSLFGANLRVSVRSRSGAAALPRFAPGQETSNDPHVQSDSARPDPRCLRLGAGQRCVRSGYAATGAAAEDSVAACPSSDFSAFLAAFAEDPALQRAWTRFPLEPLVVLHGADEPTPVERSITREQATFPLLPDAEQRISDSLDLRVEEAPAGRSRVVVEKPDTDAKVIYIFAHDGCWRWIRIEDWSL